MTKTAAATAIRASFGAWDSANASLSFAYGGATAVKSSKLDGINAVLWGGLRDGAIAVTRVWYYTSTKEIAEFDIVFNSGYGWSYTEPIVADCAGTPDYPYCDPTNAGQAGTFDLRNIATHEAGHTLMLEDLYDSSDSDLTMYGYGSYGEIKKVTLGLGDILGQNEIYP